MKYLWQFFKKMLFPLSYATIMIMASMSISLLDETKLLWLKYLLYAVALALYIIVIGAIEYKAGSDEYKIRHLNDVERIKIVETGEERPLNLVKEYKPWKGFYYGISPCVPLIILMIIQTILLFTGNPEQPQLWPGTVASYIYIVIFAFFRPNIEAYTTFAQGLNYYYLLVAIPFHIILFGVAYLLGARREKKLYAMVDAKQKAIHGDKK